MAYSRHSPGATLRPYRPKMRLSSRRSKVTRVDGATGPEASPRKNSAGSASPAVMGASFGERVHPDDCAGDNDGQGEKRGGRMTEDGKMKCESVLRRLSSVYCKPANAAPRIALGFSIVPACRSTATSSMPSPASDCDGILQDPA